MTYIRDEDELYYRVERDPGGPGGLGSYNGNDGCAAMLLWLGVVLVGGMVAIWACAKFF